MGPAHGTSRSTSPVRTETSDTGTLGRGYLLLLGPYHRRVRVSVRRRARHPLSQDTLEWYRNPHPPLPLGFSGNERGRVVGVSRRFVSSGSVSPSFPERVSVFPVCITTLVLSVGPDTWRSQGSTEPRCSSSFTFNRNRLVPPLSESPCPGTGSSVKLSVRRGLVPGTLKSQLILRSLIERSRGFLG